MKGHWKALCTSVIFISFLATSSGQVGLGLVFSNDLYHRYNNPESGDPDIHRANGSALLNLSLGPKIWVGVENVSLSLEGQANLGVLGLALSDYKGLGSVSFPFLAKLNFNGLSGLKKAGTTGFSIGGGLQYTKTELYGLSQEFADRGVTRDFYRTVVIQAGYGFGVSGFGAQFFTRYGFNSELDGANVLHFGLQFDFNIIKMKEIDDPASAL